MKFFPFLALSLLTICSSTWATSAEDGNISAVESGLLPANVFKGDKPCALKGLAELEAEK